MSVDPRRRHQWQTRLPPSPSLFDDASPNPHSFGGFDGGESITVLFGGFDGGESRTAAYFGGFDGGESITVLFGGFDGGESISAKAELATAQPAIKATRLSFIMIAPGGMFTGTSMQSAHEGQAAMVKATVRPGSPHGESTMYA
jgi:hypothetical protein